MAEKSGKQDKHKQKELSRENLTRTKSSLSPSACACLSFALSANRSPILAVNKQHIEVNMIDSLLLSSISHSYLQRRKLMPLPSPQANHTT